MTMSKMTVPQIKAELDGLGVEYKSGLRKAELLSLLEENNKEVTDEDVHYSPPYTRKRTTMTTVDITTVTNNLLKFEGSPVNHASAVIEELEEAVNQSEEVSVDVEITREVESPVVELVVTSSEETSEATHSDNSTSDQTNSEQSDVDSDAELAAGVEADIALITPETKKITRSVTKRRSERMVKHAACSGALFSDDETPALLQDTPDDVSIASEEDDSAAPRKSMLMKIFLISILFAILANVIAFLHLSHPHVLANLYKSTVALLLPSSSSQPAE